MAKPLSPHLSRRSWLRLTPAALAAGVGLVPRAGRAATHKILILGDSMIAGGFGLYLEGALRKEHGQVVLRRGKSSTGLARPDFFDWMEEGRRLLATFEPDTVITMFGGNDVQGLYMGKKEWIRWEEEGWRDEYARRVSAFADLVAPSGQHLFWVGLPIMRIPKFRKRVERVNSIFRAEMAIRPRAHFVDTWKVLTDDRGEYAEVLPVGKNKDAHGRPKRVMVRAPDGVHLTPTGAHVLKDHVLPRILKTLSLA